MSAADDALRAIMDAIEIDTVAEVSAVHFTPVGLADLAGALADMIEAARAEGEAAGRASSELRLREVGQILIAEIGAAGPTFTEDVARAAVARIQAAEAEAERLRAELAQVRAEGEATSRVAERPLGDHDARNVLWLSGRSLKQTNLTSPAALRACERFEATPRIEVAGSFPRNGPARIDALVALINECHEIHSEWHGRLISRAEAEAYVRGGAVGGAA